MPSLNFVVEHAIIRINQAKNDEHHQGLKLM